MTRRPPADVRSVAVASTGVIGGGWAAAFLAAGLDVIAWDPSPGAEHRLRAHVDNAWPALTKLGLADGADPARLSFTDDLAEACASADFVQESAPESLDLKRELLAEIDSAAPPDTVVASSTSGIGMTEMATQCGHPERLLVGHPFNPPYLIPLVEVCPGELTDPQAVAWTADFYRAVGKSPLVMDRELSGFIGNRIQEALWREVLHMVDNDEATTDQLDVAITEGPGLRWALMGPALTFHLAGGLGGMRHMLEHFGESLHEPWTRLSAPDLTPALIEKMVSGTADQAGGVDVPELEALRDEFLVDLLLLRRTYDDRLTALRAERATRQEVAP